MQMSSLEFRQPQLWNPLLFIHFLPVKKSIEAKGPDFLVLKFLIQISIKSTIEAKITVKELEPTKYQGHSEWANPQIATNFRIPKCSVHQIPAPRIVACPIPRKSKESSACGQVAKSTAGWWQRKISWYSFSDANKRPRYGNVTKIALGGKRSV
jgi:hypothetical protein